MKAGLILRESKYINAVLYSVECWHSISIRDILMFERQDQFLLRVILYNLHSKTATEYLHLETATLKIRYILAARRIMYLRYILEKDENETLKKVYVAQKEDSKKGDFIQLVRSDLLMIGLNISDQKILEMDFNQLKITVKIDAQRHVLNT